jgi:thioredoxin reductase (NADPH)
VSQTAYDVLVIGEGVSGLAAAQALAKAGARTATLEAQLFGGLIINVNELDPAPAAHTAAGAEYASELMQTNAELGVESIQEPVTAVRPRNGTFDVVTASATRHAQQVVVASGARIKKLGVPGEAEFEGRGVSQCADCDGPMYQGEPAIVVGGGDSALQEALVLAHYCGKVYLVHRGAHFRAQPRFVERVGNEPKITTLWNATLQKISGTQMVESALVCHADGKEETIPCAGVFAYVGLLPNSDFLPSEVARDSQGFVTTNSELETAVPGLWAIGAVRSGYPGLLSDALTEAQRVAAQIRQRLI